jgi:hypothetical protein
MYRQELHPVGGSMKLRVGDRVQEPSGRHVGRVEAITTGVRQGRSRAAAGADRP